LVRREQVDLVDARDRVVGSASLGECLQKGLLHRAVAIVVTRSTGRVVLQQRSKRDAWHPGKWTLSCTGHVRKGESYAEAAARELMEEIGIGADLTLMGRYLLPAMRGNGLTEREWVALFAATSDATIRIDPAELEGVKEFTPSGLKRMLSGDDLTPDSVMLLAEFMRRRP
jgi:isopentenyl-diphosphate delta-isomerase